MVVSSCLCVVLIRFFSHHKAPSVLSYLMLSVVIYLILGRKESDEHYRVAGEESDVDVMYAGTSNE